MKSKITETKKLSFARNSKQREIILEIFTHASRPLKPEEAWNLGLKKSSKIGISTIYRVINACVKQGWLVPVSVPGEPPRYEIAGKHHHHHFLCRHCDSLFEIEGCVENLDRRVPTGFKVESHEITYYGLCQKCSKTIA
ncbi:MAG: transcriptional repressor [Proteobacteria bacterium]|nr:transcriptional repressor [Pseudomonadota bacterium]